jgi:hypothetical protein
MYFGALVPKPAFCFLVYVLSQSRQSISAAVRILYRPTYSCPEAFTFLLRPRSVLSDLMHFLSLSRSISFLSEEDASSKCLESIDLDPLAWEIWDLSFESSDVRFSTSRLSFEDTCSNFLDRVNFDSSVWESWVFNFERSRAREQSASYWVLFCSP